MSIHVPPRYRAAVSEVRASLSGGELVLFDVICLSATLGTQLPQDDINLADLVGPVDPRPKLSRGIRRLLGTRDRLRDEQAWTRAGARLTTLLVRTLRSRDVLRQDADGNFEPLRSLLSFAPSVLALDCRVPSRTIARVAWTVVIRVFGQIHQSKVARLPLPWIDKRRFATLVREAAATPVATRANGERPGLSGRRLAVDPRLADAVRAALQTAVTPAYIAQYVFYARTGDYFWPHTDSLRVYVNVFICLEHTVPRGQATCSAFLAYREDGSVERFELHAGDAIAAQTQGLVHARSPLQAGERVTLLAIAFQGTRTRRPVRANRTPRSRATAPLRASRPRR
ncbi:MAG TPA: hypothetical protein VM032_12360 [Vicinamibacterales bacterium]|nr:hypothetical protein [Vicinamibacterales bacterium]